MKLKNTNFKVNLLKTNLINSRAYLNLSQSPNYNIKNKNYIFGFRNKLCVFDLNQILICIKNSCKLIYAFHKSNKKILFIGFPILEKKKFYKLLKLKKHYYISKTNWVNGLLKNKKLLLSQLKQKNTIKKKHLEIINIKKTPDLIVFYNNQKEKEIQKESLNLNIPIISFININNNKQQYSTYNIPGNFYSKQTGKIIYNIMYSILNTK
jgi:ribosomal protein S2